MEKTEFRELLVNWASDLKQELEWFYSNVGKQTVYEDVEDLYQKVQTMWFEHRDVFPNKGTYKMIRRLFIKGIAREFAFKSYAWGRLSAELCKEMLHKADQGWISYYAEFPEGFRDYLRWKALQAGYRYYRVKFPCYVDEELKVVYRGTAGIVKWHEDTSTVEVLLFAPLSYYKNIDRAYALEQCKIWGKCYYPEYEVSLPTLKACRLCNCYHSEKIQNCHLKSISANPDLHAPELPLVLVGHNDPEPAGNATVAENLYVSVYMTEEQFRKINPNICFPDCYVTD